MPVIDLSSVKLDANPDYNDPKVVADTMRYLYDEQPLPSNGQFVDLNTIKLDAPESIAVQPADDTFSSRLQADFQRRKGNDMGAITAGVQGFNSIVPFGKRITAGLASAALDPFTDLTMSELYDTARENQQATSEVNPNAELAGNLVGIAATLPIGFSKAAAKTPILGNVANALQKTATATGNFVRGSKVAADGGRLAKFANLAGQSARSALVAAPTGAVYGAGDAPEGQQLEGAASGAGMGAAIGAAIPIAAAGVGGAVGYGVNKLAKPSQIMPNSEQLESIGSKVFAAARASGETFDDVADSFISSLDSVKPAKIGGVVERAVAEDLEAGLGKYRILRNKKLSIDEVDSLDKELTDLKQQAYGQNKAFLASKYADIQNALRGSVADAPSGKALAEARDFFRKKYQMEDVERIFRNAEGRPNEAAIIQTGYRNLANQARKKGSGYTKDQIAIMDKAAKGGLSIDALKFASSKLIAGVAAGMGGPAAGATAYMGNLAAGAGATALQTAKANKLAKSITKGITVESDPTLINRAAQNLQKSFEAKKLKGK